MCIPPILACLVFVLIEANDEVRESASMKKLSIVKQQEVRVRRV